jgi:hypothetical protein
MDITSKKSACYEQVDVNSQCISNIWHASDICYSFLVVKKSLNIVLE